MKTRYEKLIKSFKKELGPIQLKIENLKLDVHQIENEIDDLAIWNKNSTVHYSHRRKEMGWVEKDRDNAKKLGCIKYKMPLGKALVESNLLLRLEIRKKQRLDKLYGLPSNSCRVLMSNAQAFS